MPALRNLQLVGGAALLLSGCYPEDDFAPPAAPMHAVDVITVRPETVSEAIELVGRIEPWREAIHYFEVTGVVKQVLVEEGAAVTEGEALAALDPTDFQLAVALAQAELATAQARLDLLNAGTREEDVEAARAEYRRSQVASGYWSRELERIENAVGAGAVTDADVDVARRERQSATENEAAAKAALDRSISGPRPQEIEAAAAEVTARQNALYQVRRQLQKATLRAHFDGVIEQRLIDPGAYVNVFPAGGVPVVHVVDLSRVDAVIAVPETLRRRFSQVEEIQVASAVDPGTRRNGKVVALATGADTDSGTYALRVRIENNDGAFAAGMVVTASHQQATPTTQILVPLTSVRSSFGQSPYVAIVLPETNEVAAQTVRLGAVHGSRVAIVEGLVGGEALVVEGQRLVLPGDQVQPRNVSNLADRSEAGPL